MSAFFLAAAPWVLAGLAVELICAELGRRAPGDKTLEGRMTAGMLFGLLVGVVLDGCGVFPDRAAALSLGPLWGMALATLPEAKRK